VILAIGAISVLSLLPLSTKQAIGTTGRLHHIGHIIAFVILMYTWGSDALTPRGIVKRAIMLAGTAILLESAQTVIYGNPFEFYDLLNDGVGIILGFVAITAFSSRWTRTRQ
jgi:hypothetical protein